MLIAAGDGVKARALGELVQHLGCDGDDSPFATMATSIDRNIHAAVTAQVDGTNADLTIYIKRILADVTSMVRQRSTHFSEYWIRREVNFFVKTGSVMLDEINSIMTAIESPNSLESYG